MIYNNRRWRARATAAGLFLWRLDYQTRSSVRGKAD